MYTHGTIRACTAQAYFGRGASAGSGEAGGGGSGRASAPTTSGHRVVAVVGEGGEERATCEGQREHRLARGRGKAEWEGR